MTAGERTTPTRLERMGTWAANAGSLQPSNPLVRRALWTAIAVAVVGSLVIALIGAGSTSDVFDWRLSPAPFLLAIVGFAVLQAFHMEMWRLILRLLHGRIEAPAARSVWCGSILARYVPSGVLVPIVRAAMAERYGVAKRITFASTLYEVALTTAGALLVGAYFILQLPALEGEPARFVIFAVPVAAVVALHPRVFGRFSAWALRRLGREPLPTTLPFAQLSGCVALYALSFVIAGAAVAALVASFAPLPREDLPTIVGSFSVTYVVSVLAFVLPAGLGAREAALVAALSPVVATPVAVAVTVAARVIQILLELGFAAVTTALRVRRQQAAAVGGLSD